MNALTAPAMRRHGVYFYQHSDFLTKRVHDFVLEGVALGETVVVVATEEHRKALRRALVQGSAIQKTAYLDMDAEEYLSGFCAGGVLDKDRYLAVVTPFLTQVQESGRPIRLYGEGVTVLWNRGFRQAALELEQWWNELIRQYRFSTVLCGYGVEAQTAEELVDVLAMHSHVCLGEAIERTG
ncbi:MEDS domain-containing protein [Nitrospira moscoviensis]|uniref:MEDS domain-containing protein n=1 Tax=Nitrospira moscoviensis TaxID=42253 RepID=A0A0K2GE59_NITMO|nr:MEDS domain-containing protein [Nitrospira moscoviensis]ALA59233.1 hypothetical protein NITMOv2_2825 [Nitrospira moscoviensis]